jgi:hypothetical protein
MRMKKKKIICVHVRVRSINYFFDLDRITGVKRRKTNSKEVWSLSAFSVQNRPKFGCRFVQPLYFLFGPF